MSIAAWHEFMGAGQLDYNANGTLTFTPPTGSVYRATWRKVATGRPDYAAKCERAVSRVPKGEPEEEHWLTFTLRNGEVTAFRRNGPPPEPDEQTELFGGAA